MVHCPLTPYHTMSLLIRNASTSDCAAVTALWRSCNLVTSYNDPSEDFHRALSTSSSSSSNATAPSNSSDVLVGTLSNRIIASAMVGTDGHRGWIYYLACDPQFQGQGHGKIMVDAAEGWLRERGVPKVQLLIRETNQGRLVPFYEKLGFEKAPTIMMGKWL